MRATNAGFVADEINMYTAEVGRRLKEMVAMFAFRATEAIQENIPIGDAASLDTNTTYANLYARRYKAYSIPEEVGYHRGALHYSESDKFNFSPTIVDAYDAANAVYDDALSQYQIGDTFYIGAAGPMSSDNRTKGEGGYDLLDRGSSDQAPEGIKTPSERSIISIYSNDLKSFYDAAE